MVNKKKFVPDPNLKLMEQVRQVLRYHHYAYRTEKSYCDWILRYIKFFKCKKHPKFMGKKEIEEYLTHLAIQGNVSPSTQRQAFNAIMFLYRDVLDIPMVDKIKPVRAKKHRSPPVVLTIDEVKRVLNNMKGTHLLMANLLYGGGLRLMECVRLRIQDLDFEKSKIYVRGAKGGKDRVTLFPRMMHDKMRDNIKRVKQLHDQDLADGYGEVYMPYALERKYPRAAKEFGWQYVFPSKKLSKDPRSGKICRHRVLESGLQKAVKLAAQQAGIVKRVGCHTFRHSFAIHLLENNVNIRAVQKLMGHTSVKTSEIYTHVMQKDVDELQSPLDLL